MNTRKEVLECFLSIMLVLVFLSHSVFASQTAISSGVFYRWGFYAPDGPALDEVGELVDAGKVSALLRCHSCHSEQFVLTKWRVKSSHM